MKGTILTLLGHGDLIYGQWTFRMHRKGSTWSQAVEQCRLHSGKLFEPSGDHGHALTSVLMVDKPIDYKMWIGIWHNNTGWNYSDATVNETYNGEMIYTYWFVI